MTGFNVKEDPRHERRTISLDELRRLVEAAQTGPPFRSMSGSMRAICYRLAVASGLRYAEIASITPESFDWNANPATVVIKAAYAKNGTTATLALPDDLAVDLDVYVATVEAGTPIFPLPHDKGAAMVRKDLKAAGIEYRDSAGRVFDFHSLRCELATIADASRSIAPGRSKDDAAQQAGDDRSLHEATRGRPGERRIHAPESETGRQPI